MVKFYIIFVFLVQDFVPTIWGVNQGQVGASPLPPSELEAAQINTLRV